MALLVLRVPVLSGDFSDLITLLMFVVLPGHFRPM